MATHAAAAPGSSSNNSNSWVSVGTSGTAAKPTWLNKVAKEKTALLQKLFAMEPIHVDVKHPVTKELRPRCQGEDILRVWDELYASDPVVQSIVIDTATGPSTPGRDYCDDAASANPAMPYQQLRALVGDGGKWKWPEIWKNLDLLPRRGPAWRHVDDPSNLGSIPNPNPDIVPLDCLVVGGGPVGLRLAIELVLGGHRVTLFEKRREVRDPTTGILTTAGFTNRVNRPHIKNFCRNDLDRLNGRNFMTPKMCYPVFTNDHTSSIGIDEAQMMLLKTALLLGVRFELGVGYSDASVRVDEASSSQRPVWRVSYTADAVACERYGKQATGGTQDFDALFGCDGGNSRVRNSQSDWLGTPKTRRYKKMYGIVSNLQKCSKKKLQSLGFSSGLEPEDRAGALTGVFFYKASYHNYLIVHPSEAEMAAHGIPWRGIFGFDKARSEAVAAMHGTTKDTNENNHATTSALKATLKRYMAQKAKELNLPIDETLPNGGFVDAPNDVMGFDFSEFYNCENSAACSVPPLDWNRDRDGDWEIHCPLVALAGDSVADPNWLHGVGLQRGWNSALDACFYADNIYNNKSFNGRPPDVQKPIEHPIEWSEHLDNLANLMTKLGNHSRDSRLSQEMNSGMLDEKGPVVLQLSKLLKSRDVDAPVPQYLPVVEPWYRYQEYEGAIRNNYKGKLLFDNIHPTTTRELAIFRKNHRFVEKGVYLRNTVTRPTAAMLTWSKRFECSAFWCDMSMKLLRIDGKAAPGEPITESIGVASTDVAAANAKAPETHKKNAEAIPLANSKERPRMNSSEVQAVAQAKSDSLRNSIVVAAMSPSPMGIRREDRSSIDAILSQAAKKGKTASRTQLLDDDTPSVGSSRSKQSHVTHQPAVAASETVLAASVATTTGVSGPNSLSVMQKLSQQLESYQNSSSNDPLLELRMLKLRTDRELCMARLEIARAQISKAEAEEAVALAKKACAQKEVEVQRSLLEAYAQAESKLRSMAK